MSQQYIRKVGLVVTKVVPHQASDQGLDLSNMQIQFHISAMDQGVPTTATIRVFNLADNTARSIQNEFQKVVLQAGYRDSNFGIIFQGTIKQVRRGRLSNIDKFVDIFAADGDDWFTFGGLKGTSEPSASSQDQLASSLVDSGIEKGQIDLSKAGVPGGGQAFLPRGKVRFGLAKYAANVIANSTNTSWFVQDGKINFLSRSGYLPGDIVVLTAQTGLVMVPEATIDGIHVKCLLNPLIKVGRRIQINNKAINSISPIKQDVLPGYFGAPLQAPASVTEDGVYRVLVIEHEGDSRGGERSPWFSNITCLALDSNNAGAQVKAGNQ